MLLQKKSFFGISKFSFFLFLLFFSVLIFLPKNAHALGASPGKFVEENLANGIKIERKVNISRANPKSTDYFEVTTSGEGGKYIELTDKIFVAQKGEGSVPYVFYISPKNAANGNYTAFVNFMPTQLPEHKLSGGGSGVSFAAGVSVTVKFSITDKEIKSFKIVNAFLDGQTEVGQPIFGYLIVKNDGNVDIKFDSIKFNFVDATDESNKVEAMIGRDNIPFISPGAEETISVSISPNIEQGQYKGSIQVIDNGNVVFENNNVLIAVYAPGTLSQKAEFVSFQSDKQEYALDELIKFNGNLKNTGDIGLDAIMVVELEQDEKSIDILKSEKKSLLKLRNSDFDVVFRTDKKGKYKATGYFEYGINKTDKKFVEFEVGKDNALYYLIAGFGGLTLVVVLAFVIFFFINKGRVKKKIKQKNIIKKK